MKNKVMSRRAARAELSEDVERGKGTKRGFGKRTDRDADEEGSSRRRRNKERHSRRPERGDPDDSDDIEHGERRSKHGNAKKSRRDRDGSKHGGSSREDHELRELAVVDLSRSGLTEKDYKRLKLEVLTREETDKFVGEPRASYKIPYFDLEGSRIAYSRVRFLENRKKKAFRKSVRDGSFRYSQPFNSAPHVYFPPYFNWKKIAKNPETPILITEGEKKAACACKLGIACIALGGVYGFKSGKRFYDLLPELADIAWKDREVEICFDADVMMKSEVHQALSQLATTLTQNYELASLEFVFLSAESGAGAKTGLDDYLVEYGVEEFGKLKRQPFRANAKIQLLNQRVCFVKRHDRFFNLETHQFFRGFWQVREAYMNEGRELIDAKTTKLVIDLWAESASRRTVNDVVYMPGAAEHTDEGVLNLWKPPSIQPKKGTPKRWLELVEYIMRDGEYAEWFLKWLAYPVQNPGAKLLQAVFVYGEKQGIGKTFIVDPVMEFVYGKPNFHRLQSDDLTSKHNTYAANKTFIVTNEVWLPEFRDRRSAMSILKDMITRERVTVDEKFQPKVTYDDHCNYYFTSNHADALVLEGGDRRFFVIEAPTKKLPQSDYNELDTWVREGDGASVILRYLQNLDLTDFNPKADALQTKWRRDIIDISKDPLGEFVESIAKEPELKFMMNGSLPDLELFRAEDMVRLFEHHNPRYRFNVTASRIGRMLSTSKLEKRNVRIDKKAPLLTLYSVFNRDKWSDENNKSWAEHYVHNARLFGGKSRH